MEPHIDEEDLELYSMRRLKGAALDQAEGHLLVCAECRARLLETDEYVRTLKKTLTSDLPDRDDLI